MSPGKELSIDKMKKCLLVKNICRMLSFSEHVDLGREKRERCGQEVRFSCPHFSPLRSGAQCLWKKRAHVCGRI